MVDPQRTFIILKVVLNEITARVVPLNLIL